MSHFLSPHLLKDMKSLALHAAALVSVVLSALSHKAVLAQSALLPQGATVVNGQANINTSGSQMNVTITPGAVINWNSFNIGTGAGVNFQQQNANSSVMNRVTGGNISTIHGNLTSNGRVILVNPAGLVIGAGAVVDTAGFVGSALNAAEANAQLDRLRLDSAGGAGRIQVDGVIRSQNGDIVLIAPDIGIGASALIKAPNGAVTLAAGQRVQLHGKGLDGITLELQAPTNSAINLGRLEGEAVGLFAGQLRHSGIIDARQASIEGGRIVLKAAENLTVTGVMNANGRSDALGNSGKGGNITLEGQRISLQGASISASGPAGGGKVSVGGGWQGRDSTIRNASRTTVDQTTRINVNALAAGNGGQVVVWSDGDTWYAGKIEAKGGALSGNGGRVEVSGKERLGYHGIVNTTAANGQAGSLLLDPKNIYIVSSGGMPATSTAFVDGGTFDFSIDPNTFSSLLGTVTLQASNDIFVIEDINAGVGGGYHLILEAGRSVFVNANINLASYPFVTNSNTLLIIANSSAIPGGRDTGVGRIVMNGGSINMSSKDSVELVVQAGSGGVSGGDIVLTDVTAGTIQAHAQTGISRGAGGVKLTGGHVVLSTQLNGIGTDTNAIRVSPFAENPTVNLSLYAGGAGGEAYIANGNHSGSEDFRLAPSAFNTNYSALVAGQLDVRNGTGRILVGAVAGETGSANISASDIYLSTSGTGGNSQIVIAQSNGQPLSVSATGSILLDTFHSNLPNAILIGGAGSAGELVVYAGSAVTAYADGAGTFPGVFVSAGDASTHTTVVSAGGLVALEAAGDVSVFGATVGTNTTTAVTALRSHSGNIVVQALGSHAGSVNGGVVFLNANSTSSEAGEIRVAANQFASAAVTSGAGGVEASAGNYLSVISTDAVNQTSRIEAADGGSVSLTAANIHITGGDQNGAKASVATQGGGSVNVTSGYIALRSGTGNDSGAAVDSSGNVSITMVSGINKLSIDASGARNSNTGIRASGSVDINTGELRITASEGPTNNTLFGITATGHVSVTASSAIMIANSTDAASIQSSAVIYGGAGITLNMTNSDQAISVAGGAGVRTDAKIGSLGQVNITSAGRVEVTGGSGTGSFAEIGTEGNLTVNAGALNLKSGTGFGDAGAIVYADQNLAVNAPNILIDASGARNSFTGIEANNIYISANNLIISPVSGAASNANYGITANGLLNIEAQTVELSGVGYELSTNTEAFLAGRTGVQITAGSGIVVKAGDGLSANARIVSNGNITLTGLVTLDAGFGTNSLALVTTSGSVTLSEAPHFHASAGGTSHALIYAGANSVTLALMYPSAQVATIAEVNASAVGIGAILVPRPDIGVTIVLPSGVPTSTTGTAVVIFTNPSPFTSTFTATTAINGATQNFLVTVGSNGSTSVPVVIPLAVADVSTLLSAPPTAPAGSLVPVTYTFTNNSAFTTTFTPLLLNNGVTTTLAQVTLAPGQSATGSQTVMIAGSAINLSINAGSLTLPDLNLSNNTSMAGTAALLPNVITTVSIPASATVGSTTTAQVTYVNTGSVGAQFTSTVVVGGVTQSSVITLGAGQSQSFAVTVAVGTTGTSVSANAINVYDQNPSDNANSAFIHGIVPTPPIVAITDVSTLISAPSSAPAGSLVPVTYTFTNNSAFTTTFTPLLLNNGVTTTLAPITLAPSQSTTGTQQVMISGVPISFSANVSNSSLPDSNLSNNISSVGTSVLLPNVIATISSPPSATVGTTVSAIVTYLNTGTVSSQFTSTVVVGSVAQLSVITLAAGQSQSFVVGVPVSATTGVTVSANAINLYDQNFGDNTASTLIAGFLPNAPVVIPPSETATIAVPSATPVIQNIILAQNVVLGTLTPSGSVITTNNSGDTKDQLPNAREDVQADGGAPICRR